MPSSYTSSLRFEKQFTGENVNLWGDKLNAVFDRADSAISGWLTKPLTGDVTLTTANGAADEARNAMLKFTGMGTFTVTIPAVAKRYDVWNACTGDLTLTNGSASVVVKVGEVVAVVTDGGSGFRRVLPTDFAGASLISVARVSGLSTPSAGSDATSKSYVDGAIAAAAYSAGTFGVVILPGDSGKILTNNGSAPNWSASLSGLTFTSATLTSPAISAPAVIGGMSFDGSTKQGVVSVAAADIDLSQGEFFTKTMSANTTFTFSNATASKAQAFALKLTISSSAVSTWPAAVKWTGGVTPTLGNGTHVIGFVTFDGGMSYVGVLAGYAVA